MTVYSILVFSVSSQNIDYYKKCLDKLNCKSVFVYAHHVYEHYLQNDKFDLIIIDLELDSTDALSILKETQLHHLDKLPLIAVCANKADDFIQISALNSGADIFIELPLSPLIFESKIKALLRHANKNQMSQKPYLYIDYERYTVVVGDHDYTLPRLEFKLLDLLCSNPNKIFSKDEIATQIWHNKEVSSKRTIDIHIRNIRRELGNDIIKTYRGLGYSIQLNSL
jgi:two-component system, OmpR family, alkaline phosphatase synthesis response regulator PhoP